ncbi:MAG: DUF2911 domain-containing protein [Acidobacteriaceae bacterium]|nr:DUF2911 domain-containing protein [Acidobacteriaceae bacterium]
MTHRSLPILFAMLPLLACAQLACAQGHGNRVSPHETVSVDLKGDKITISYGRPYLKGRKLDDIEAYGKVWRLGADEATKLTVTTKTRIGDSLELEPGSYSLFAMAGADKWTIIVNRVADQWGAFSYKQSDDLGRFDVPVKQGSPVEQFTISLTKQSDSAATLSFAWGDTSVSTAVKPM